MYSYNTVELLQYNYTGIMNNKSPLKVFLKSFQTETLPSIFVMGLWGCTCTVYIANKSNITR